MIFVTVGTQLPFERLVRSVDAWAGAHPSAEVFAQIGKSGTAPLHMKWTRHLDPHAFRARFEAAGLVVSHAGIGNVLLALELEKPLIVMPRRLDLREHRNDHQMATAEWLRERAGVRVARDAPALIDCLERGDWTVPRGRPSANLARLLATVEEFIAAS